jgi:integrase
MGDLTQSAELELAVHLVLSRVLGTQRGGRAYNPAICLLVTAIGDYERTRGPLVSRALKRREMSPFDLDDLWAVAKGNGQLLDRDLVACFFPSAVWQGVADFIGLGPVRAWQRAEQILTCWSRGFEPDGSRRAKRMSAKTIELLAGGFQRLAKELCELRKLADAEAIPLDPQLLSAWRAEQMPAKLSAKQLGATPANSDRRAPSLSAARKALKAAHSDVERRKRLAQTRRGMGDRLRNRALLAVFLVTGARAGAVLSLTRGEFVRYHRSGEHVGPAILLRPGKTLERDLVRVKVLPEVVGDWIQEWIDYRGLDDPDTPLWPVSTNRPIAIERQSVSGVIGKMLAPFVPDRNCSPHTLRHLAEKLAFQAGMDWLDANRQQLLDDESLSGMPSSPQTFADALLDHSLSTVQDTYKDINSERGRETWARIAAAGVWDYIWGERGAPRGPDVERIKAARAQLAAAEGREGSTPPAGCKRLDT